jgi:hypothetical protein
VGTTWRLLKVYFDGDGSAWGAYMPAEEACVVDEDDLRHFTKEKLLASYDIELAELHKVRLCACLPHRRHLAHSVS